MPGLLGILFAILGLGAAAGGSGGSEAAPATPTTSGRTPAESEDDSRDEEDDGPASGDGGGAPPAGLQVPIIEDDVPLQEAPLQPQEPIEEPSAPSGAPNLPNSAYALSWEGLTDQEQLMLELVNRARMDPEAEVIRTGEIVDADVSTAPKQALAVDPILSAAADNHSADMLARDFFAHTNPDGDGPTDRAQDEGWTGRGVWENIAARWTGAQSVSDEQAWIEASHFGLWKSDGHQYGMLQPQHTVVGIGVDWGDWAYPSSPVPTAMVVTEKFSNDSQTYLTGVVIDDADGDDFYDLGEGQGDVKITVWNDDDVYATSTWASGGYSLALDSGTYNVRFEGGDLDTAYETEVTIGSQNVKLDVNEDDLSSIGLATLSEDPTLVEDDPIEALFLSADASLEAIERAAAEADAALLAPEPEDLLEMF